MWILQYLPESLIILFCNLVLITGLGLTAASWFAHRIPVVYNYQLPLKIIGVILLAMGVYLRGGVAVEHQWRERVHQLEEKLKLAEAESAKVNTVVQTRVVTKTQVVKQKADALIEYVDREIVKEADCRLPQEAIDVHNEAARMNKLIEEQRKGRK